MKVHVNVRVAAEGKQQTPAGPSYAVDVVLAPGETVGSLKERLAEAEAVPFPSRCLLLGGEALADERVLLDCGVKDSDALDFVIQASTETLVAQLVELLQKRDVSCDELGLMYSYKFGGSISQALKLLGLESSLQDFLAKQPSSGIAVCSGVASLQQRAGTGLRSFSVAAEAEQLLRSTPTGSMEIKELCIKFASKFGVSLTSVAGVRPADFFAREASLFTMPRPGYVCLKGRAPPPEGSVAAPAGPDEDVDLPPGLERPPGLDANAPVFQPMCAAQAPPPKPAVCRWFLKGECWEGDRCKLSHTVEAASGQDDSKYMELHEKIFSRRSDAGASQALDEVIRVLQEAVFFRVDRVARGGPLEKGTAISGPAGVHAEVVFFLPAIPAKSRDRWMTPLLRAVGGTLAEKLEGKHGIEGVRATDDSVRLRVAPQGVGGAPPLVVDLRFSPAFGSRAEAVEAQAQKLNSPHTRRLYSASFVEERVQFVARQPDAVKVTIRLLKWWRDQQEWSSRFTHPPDEVLEVLAAYSAAQTKPADQRSAVANVMSLFSRFDELRVVWSDLYTKDDVWKPLLKQRPLLMDPVNPYSNIADLQVFDGRELSAAAKTTHFFW
mmetsp:Transcript_100224/g.261268  ORF Transcript_100224/g.261268 Transcript_100224/m.261268 type:complete len:608 (+) Transcript_100224:118-1941(+)